MLSGVASGATDGAEVEYGREWNPYVMLRGGLLFGESKISCNAEGVPLSAKVRSKNITLRKRLNEKAFLYGGVGGGINHANIWFKCEVKADDVDETWLLEGHKSIWRLFGQAFAGGGVCL